MIVVGEADQGRVILIDVYVSASEIFVNGVSDFFVVDLYLLYKFIFMQGIINQTT